MEVGTRYVLIRAAWFFVGVVAAVFLPSHAPHPAAGRIAP
jgi:hypothetical protein